MKSFLRRTEPNAYRLLAGTGARSSSFFLAHQVRMLSALLPKTAARDCTAQHLDPYGDLRYSCGRGCTERIKGYTLPLQISTKMSRQPPLLATVHTQEYFYLGEQSPVIPGCDWLPEQKDRVCCSSSLRTDRWHI